MEVLRVQRRVVVEGLQTVTELSDACGLVGGRSRQRVQEPLADAGTLRVDEQQAHDVVRVCLCEQDRHVRAIGVRSDHERPADAGRIEQRAKVGDLVRGGARRFHGRLALPEPGAVMGCFLDLSDHTVSDTSG
jgi:hypothetical protein